MKPRTWIVPAATLLAVFLAGCLEERLIWSPDGSRAAVITKEGLYLCDGDGNLSGLMEHGVYLAAWNGDSSHLVLARAQEVRDSASLGAALGKGRADAIAAEAEVMLRQLQAGRSADEVGKEAGSDAIAEVLYLREHHTDALHSLLGKDWDEIKDMPATLYSLVSATIAGDKVVLGPSIYLELAKIADIRPSPSGKVVAFVTGMDPNPDKDYRILLAPADASQPPVTVAEHTTAYPDWDAGGLGLAFLQASEGSSNELRLGTLVQRTVLDADGRIHIGPRAQDREPVGLVLQPLNRVRCLADGRILFNASEFHLPMLKQDKKAQEQLFALSPGAKPADSSLVALLKPGDLPGMLSFFEVSPDGRQVLIDGDGGKIWILTLGTGEVEFVSGAAIKESNLFAAEWRGPGEFTYARRAPQKTGSASPRNVDVVLRRGKTETVLSQHWPDSMMGQFIY